MTYLQYFEEICAIPHPSYHTEKLRDYLVSFAKDHELMYYSDDANNVIIYKKASDGCQDMDPIILQGHIDMVGEKSQDSNHDFLTDPLKLNYDGDWLSAVDTTLGADDGIAVAMMLAILSDDRLVHPPIEAVFTSEEEVGMDGAKALDTDKLKGKILINVDSEDEGILTAGCAGGGCVDMDLPATRELRTGLPISIEIGGLKGGHSGVSINEGHANGIKLMGLILLSISASSNAGVTDISCGEKDNVIPSKGSVSLICPENEIETVMDSIATVSEHFDKEYKDAEDDIEVTLSIGEHIVTEEVVCGEDLYRLVNLLDFMPYGPLVMSPDMPGLVQTSANPGILKLKETFKLVTSVRSSVAFERDKLIYDIIKITEDHGGTASTHGLYPAWEFNPTSKLRDTMCDLYHEMTGKDMKVEVIHAGLECGYFSQKIPGLDAVSIGPDIPDIHTTKERLSISSADRVYDYLIKLLEKLTVS